MILLFSQSVQFSKYEASQYLSQTIRRYDLLDSFNPYSWLNYHKIMDRLSISRQEICVKEYFLRGHGFCTLQD